MSSGKTVHEFFGQVMDRMLGLQPVAAPEPRMQNLANKRMHIRAVGVREGFAAMRARLDSLRVAYRIAEVPLTKQRQIFLGDPAGNGVELNFDAREEA